MANPNIVGRSWIFINCFPILLCLTCILCPFNNFITKHPFPQTHMLYIIHIFNQKSFLNTNSYQTLIPYNVSRTHIKLTYNFIRFHPILSFSYFPIYILEVLIICLLVRLLTNYLICKKNKI